MTKEATSVARYSRFFRLSHVDTVLDYGTGTLRNALYLVEQGFTVYAADVPDQVKVLRGHPEVNRLAGLLRVGELPQSRLGVDLVVSTYVFNIIVQKDRRRRYLNNVVANLRPGGYFLMEVNCRRDVPQCGAALERYYHCNDGSRNYSHDDLDRILSPYGFKRICHYYSSHALAAVFRLTGESGLPLDAGGEERLSGRDGRLQTHVEPA